MTRRFYFERVADLTRRLHLYGVANPALGAFPFAYVGSVGFVVKLDEHTVGRYACAFDAALSMAKSEERRGVQRDLEKKSKKT